MSSTKIATSVLQGFLDAFNAHDVDAIMSFFAEDCVLDMPRGPAPGGRRLVGKEQVREGIQSRLDGIPDIHYGDDRHWICGDRGVSEWTIRGTQRTGEPHRGPRVRPARVRRREDQPQGLLLEDRRLTGRPPSMQAGVPNTRDTSRTFA